MEEPLFLVEQLLDELEQCHTRIAATIQVWPETGRTLKPALSLLDGKVSKHLQDLQTKLAFLWKQGAARLWK